LHAGWVLANEFARWLGGGSVIEYATCWPVLLLLLVVMAWRLRKRPSFEENPSP